MCKRWCFIRNSGAFFGALSQNSGAFLKNTKNSKEIYDSLAKHFQNMSSNKNHTEEFQTQRKQAEAKSTNHFKDMGPKNSPLNDNITLYEWDQAKKPDGERARRSAGAQKHPSRGTVS